MVNSDKQERSRIVQYKNRNVQMYRNKMSIVANHRVTETSEGKQDCLQAQRLVDFTNKHNLIQQVDKVSLEPDLIYKVWENTLLICP